MNAVTDERRKDHTRNLRYLEYINMKTKSHKLKVFLENAVRQQNFSL